jgi:hypothetical protein
MLWHAQAAKACPRRMRQIKAWIARLLGLLLGAAECAAEPLSKPQESYISALGACVSGPCVTFTVLCRAMSDSLSCSMR